MSRGGFRIGEYIDCYRLISKDWIGHFYGRLIENSLRKSTERRTIEHFFQALYNCILIYFYVEQFAHCSLYYIRSEI